MEPVTSRHSQYEVGSGFSPTQLAKLQQRVFLVDLRIPRTSNELAIVFVMNCCKL